MIVNLSGVEFRVGQDANIQICSQYLTDIWVQLNF